MALATMRRQKNLANHNRLAFHTLMITSVGVTSRQAPVKYSRAGGMKKLSGELVAAWQANVAATAHESLLVLPEGRYLNCSPLCKGNCLVS